MAERVLYEQSGLHATLRRIGGMVLRHWYVIRPSVPSTAELVFWPLVSMLMWGFLQTYLAQTTSLAARAAGLFVGGILLWDILVRSQLGYAVAFLEEIWARNLGHLMMSPLRPAELVPWPYFDRGRLALGDGRGKHRLADRFHAVAHCVRLLSRIDAARLDAAP